MFHERRLKEQDFECPENTWSTKNEKGAQRAASRHPKQIRSFLNLGKISACNKFYFGVETRKISPSHL